MLTGASPLLPEAAAAAEEGQLALPVVAPRSWTRGELIGQGAFGQVHSWAALEQRPCPIGVLCTFVDFCLLDH